MKKQEFSLRFIRHQTFKNAQSEDLQRTQIKQTRFNIKKTKSAQIEQPDLAGRYMQYQTSKQFVEIRCPKAFRGFADDPSMTKDGRKMASWHFLICRMARNGP